MDASVKQKRRWLIEFALASLIPIVVVGLLLGEAIHSQAKTRATAMARQEAQMVGDVAFRRVLGPGTYRAVLVATDAAGNASAPKRLGFKIVRR